jgi:hypothetical protein
LVSVSFQRNPRPSKIGCSVSDKGDAARQIETAGAAALAKAADHLIFGRAGKALAGQPVHQVQPRLRVHQGIMPGNHLS